MLGLRKGKVGAGMWCPPGGKLEMYEDWETCAIRETREETGLGIKNLRLMTVTNDPSPHVGTHYITVAFVADLESGEASLVEPDNFDRWEWFAWNKLPEPLFWPTQNFVNTKLNPFDF